MKRRELGPTTLLFPLPAVLVSCAHDGRRNVLTIAWTSTVASQPPAVAIGVRPERYSHEIIKSSGGFVINVPARDMLYATDYCGTVSGKTVDKFEALKLNTAPARVVEAPLITDCPINIECIVRHTLECGSHTVFIGEVVEVHIDESIVGPGGDIDVARMGPFAFYGAGYWSLGSKLENRGFSIRQPVP